MRRQPTAGVDRRKQTDGMNMHTSELVLEKLGEAEYMEKFPLAEEMHEVYQPKVFAELPEEDRKMVLNVTRVDRLLHRYAVQRFIHDAKLVEKASGKRFLCGETRKKLDGFLREHAEGELEANLGVKWTEFKPNAKSKQHHAEASMGAMMPMGERKKLKAYSDVESDALMRPVRPFEWRREQAFCL